MGELTLTGLNDLARHHAPLTAELTEAWRGVLGRGNFILGSEVAKFEMAFAAFCQSEHAIGVGNGTDALELALKGVGVTRGDRVILTANAGGYGSAAVRAIGALPVYVDVDPGTRTLSAPALEEEVSRSSARAVVVTHLYGRMADMPALSPICTESGTSLIEDCAQAHGASIGGRMAGSWGKAAAFSFYPTKNLGALGDAGAVVTSDHEVADRVRSLRQYGWKTRYDAVEPGGRNTRMDELQAAVLTLKLRRLAGWNRRRTVIANTYRAQITHPAVSLPAGGGPDDVAHLFVAQTPERGSLIAHLTGLAIPHGIHFPEPDYRQPGYGPAHAMPALPVTELLCRQVVSLPCFPEMTDREVQHVAAAVNAWEP